MIRKEYRDGLMRFYERLCEEELQIVRRKHINILGDLQRFLDTREGMVPSIDPIRSLEGRVGSNSRWAELVIAMEATANLSKAFDVEGNDA